MGSLVCLALFIIMVRLVKSGEPSSAGAATPAVTLVRFHEQQPAEPEPGRFPRHEPFESGKPPKPVPVRRGKPVTVPRGAIPLDLPRPGTPARRPGNVRPGLDLDYRGGEFRSRNNRALKPSGGGAPPGYARPGTEVPAMPERFHVTGGGEIDRIGNECFAVPDRVASARSQGQTVAQVNRTRAMPPLFAHRVSCGDDASGLAADFLKHLRERGLMPVPSARTR